MREPLNTLRDRAIGTAEFRTAAQKICTRLLNKQKALLQKRRVPLERVVIVIILRAATAFLATALHTFPDAPVGVLGLKRRTRTFSPRWYYENLPPLSKQSVAVVLDPMLATGGSAQAAVSHLIKRGANPKNIYFVGIIGAPEGLARLGRSIPQENIMLAAVDSGLDTQKLIVPGLGDFGDRYFGYDGDALLGGK